MRARLAPGTVRAGGDGMVTSTRGGSGWACGAQPATHPARRGTAASSQISLLIRRPRAGSPTDERLRERSLLNHQTLLFRLEIQRGGIDAVPQAVVARTVLEDVSQVGAAAAAGHLDADHAVAAILVGVDVALFRRPGETGPAGAGVELHV